MKRVKWVDISKAIAILLLPISHTIANPSLLRSLIFSFHMPLFFVASGYTSSPVNDFRTLARKTKKNCLFLIMSAFLSLIIYGFLAAFQFHDGTVIDSILQTMQEFFFQIPPRGVGNIGAVWFFLALFYVKALANSLSLLTVKQKPALRENIVISGLIILGAIGILLCRTKIGLPFYLDIGLSTAFYYGVGMLYKKISGVFQKHENKLLLPSLILWLIPVLNNKNIEIWERAYPLTGIFASLFGIFVIFYLSKKLDRLKLKIVSYLRIIGQHTFIFFLIHCFDEILFCRFWDFRDGSYFTFYISSFLRMVIDIVFFVIIYHLIQKGKEKKC